MVKRIDTLNALDEAFAEEVSGEPITNVDVPDAPKVKIYCALAWIIERRTNPGIGSYDDYLKTHRLKDALEVVFGEDESAGADAGAEEGTPEDQFPADGAPATPAAVEGAAADAEGPVLPGDGAQPG